MQNKDPLGCKVLEWGNSYKIWHCYLTHPEKILPLSASKFCAIIHHSKCVHELNKQIISTSLWKCSLRHHNFLKTLQERKKCIFLKELRKKNLFYGFPVMPP
mmetsp:Transcript_25281/g.38334  ORF Transcript_25281/g.38334 Transcript_25281/m.38334 type:complete len:102 (+) Transcript_25281:2049-2354(+)